MRAKISNFELLGCVWVQTEHPICMPVDVCDTSHIH